jgi:ribosome biogenesis GTPase A
MPFLASASALRTSRLPGMTRTMSTRLKLNLDPPIYSVDSPGVMVPFLGYGERANERGLKLALICKSSLTKRLLLGRRAYILCSRNQRGLV